MPQLGESVNEGTVTRWLRAVGDHVGLDEPLLEVSTDKVDTEVTAPASGTLLRILVGADTTVPVGEVIAMIGDAAPDLGERPARHRHSPRVRRLAARHGVVLDGLAGSGPAGRVTGDDVLAAAAARSDPAVDPDPVADPGPDPAPAAGPAPASTPPASSAVTEPRPGTHVTSVVEVDMSRVVAFVEGERAGAGADGVRPTVVAFVARCVVEGLGLHPSLNAQAVGGHARTHLGIGIDTSRGLVVPVVRDAGGLNLPGIAHRIADLARRAGAGELPPGELTGGTFTIVDSGHRGVLFGTLVLKPPQVAALDIGAVVERPVVVRGEGGERAIVIRSMAYLALTCDGRLVGDAEAARFLVTVKDRLEAGRFAHELI
jgi:2-oxoglutarate dehydrogenase E2 component (dihydrolipoamide succinyltransferase)